MRWREYRGRVEAVLFAAPQPVTREALARVVGADVRIEALIADIGEELRARPYEIAFVAGGGRLRTPKKFASRPRNQPRSPRHVARRRAPLPPAPARPSPAPVTYVTTAAFLERFGFASLRDLPDMERLEDEGHLSKEAPLSAELAAAFGIESDEPDGVAEDAASDGAEPLSRGEDD